MAETIEHRENCELLTVETYGLCTCDFDRRKRQEARDKIRDRDMAIMDAIAAKHGEGELFFRAMEVATQNLRAFDRKLEPRT